MTTLAFLDIGFGEMVVVGIVALLLFGGRLPDVMRTLGGSYRTFRRGWEDLSRQAMRPDLIGKPPYRPTPPASSAAPVASSIVPAQPAPSPQGAPAAQRTGTSSPDRSRPASNVGPALPKSDAPRPPARLDDAPLV